MLRIRFTGEDLARTHVSTGPDPLWETILGMQQLVSGGRGSLGFRDWLRRARAVVGQRNLRGQVRYLRALIPQKGYVPDFLTPAEAAGGLREGLAAVRDTPRARLCAELRLLAADRYSGGVPPVMRRLAEADPRLMTELAEALREVYESVIAPDWTQLHTHVEADRALRARALRDGGIDLLLDSLGAAVRWDPPVLHVNYPVERDLQLAGRGLRLIPSRFCSRVPIALADARLRPVLVYPVNRSVPEPVGRPVDPLGGVVGRTRAGILRALRDGATTGELALRLRISAAAASQHVHALGRARLVHSQRVGACVLHTLTPLGVALLDGHIPPSPSGQRFFEMP
ncbi:ArsR family transcriptional regulator [Streptomyces xinghaiensis]|uniref:ArsR family transcriptional regulator n=2 Tax=Streptomyces TaxID=1883 RepID=A0A3R7EP03_9ACTN|nr:ArsR family transcriptional regulator [Streptomyces xinghaiensis]RKM93181.1 ArsR family transcriptional regulator [Streptomyces xinghaiensis]RNC71221.1 ArsR family transcriptional regulator [Streptomyces xinghaiensis]